MFETPLDPTADPFDVLLMQERPRLVQLCARLSGNAAPAEDLAQETLLEAWHQRDRLHDWSGASHWLTAIARFMCLRWRRRQAREWSYHAPRCDAAPEIATYAHTSAAACDMEVELERHELAELLDRALALLPADARTVLVAKYIENSPHAEIAAQLGVSEGAVAMRLQRGKLAFRHLLSTELKQEAAAYGLVHEPSDRWQAMRMWCPFCGVERLEWRHDDVKSQTIFRCPRCTANASTTQLVSTNAHVTARDLRSIRTLLVRTLAHLHHVYRDALAVRTAACWRCERSIPVKLRLDEAGMYGLTIRCDTCGCLDISDLHYLIVDHPATQRFWQAHKRVRMYPPHPITFCHRPALLTKVEHVAGTAAIEFISAADTLDVLAVEHVHQAPAHAAKRSE